MWRGSPSTATVTPHRLTIRERVRLFLDVLDAVQFAHQNLLVHRDLKPSNIFVTEKAEVRLLDFGVAKLLSEVEEDEATHALAEAAHGGDEVSTGQRLMTPAYAAPEQLQGGKVTTATDVYALGVLLYELLVGRRPRQREGGVAAASASPIPPNEALTEADRETGDEIATARRTSSRRLQRQLRGDLDRIVLKALAEEPRRRYGSAEALAEDLRRYLAVQPVAAREGRWPYRARRFVRRHWKGLAVTTLVVGMLITAAGLAWRQAVVAEREATRAGEVEAFLVGLFESANPYEEEDASKLTARELLDRGVRRVRTELVAEPAVQAELLGTMGAAYRALGLYGAADSLFAETLVLKRQLYGSEDERVADGVSAVAGLRHLQGDYKTADSLHREVLRLRRQTLGTEHPDVAASLEGLAEALRGQGELEAADSLHRAALQLRQQLPDKSAVAKGLNKLATLLHTQGAYAEADSLLREALAIQERASGSTNPGARTAFGLDRAPLVHNLAGVREAMGDFEAAATLYEEALELKRAHLDAGHPDVLLTLNNLAGVRYRVGDFAGSEAAFREALEARRQVLGDGHPDVAISLSNLATVLQAQEKYEAAEPLMREALRVAEEVYGEDHAQTATVRNNLGTILLMQGEAAEAEPLFRRALEVQREKLGESHPSLATALINLGQALLEQGEPESAEAPLREAYDVLHGALGADDWRTAAAASALGEALTAQGDFEAAEALLVRAHEVLGEGAQERHTRKARGRLHALYTAWGKPEQAAEYAATE